MRVYRKILGPVYGSEKENWRILTNKKIHASVKKPTVTETRRLTLRLLMSYIYIYIYIYIYMERLFLMFLDHTQRRTTVGRTPLDE